MTVDTLRACPRPAVRRPTTRPTPRHQPVRQSPPRRTIVSGAMTPTRGGPAPRCGPRDGGGTARPHRWGWGRRAGVAGSGSLGVLPAGGSGGGWFWALSPCSGWAPCWATRTSSASRSTRTSKVSCRSSPRLGRIWPRERSPALRSPGPPRPSLRRGSMSSGRGSRSGSPGVFRSSAVRSRPCAWRRRPPRRRWRRPPCSSRWWGRRWARPAPTGESPRRSSTTAPPTSRSSSD